MFVRQAANVVELLEFFAERQRPATLAEIADALNWPRSSTYNLITTLVSKGYFYEPRARGGYYPSQSWRRRATVIADAEPLPEAAEFLAQEMADVTGETACIAAPAGTSGLLVYAVESRKPIRFSSWQGQLNPIHASASGRAILAQYTAAERHSLYRKIKFEAYTPKSPMSIAEIEAALRLGMSRGYHVSDEEVIEDVVTVAAPMPLNGRTLALLVAGPVYRCRPKTDAFGELIRDSADKLCRELNAIDADRPARRVG
jgi:DNA-binding IclR family transcriptional regulator